MTRLAETIRARGLTFRDVHAAGGPSPATLTRLLRGERQWRPEWVASVAALLDLSAEEVTIGPAERPALIVQLASAPDVLPAAEVARVRRCSVDFVYQRTDLLPPIRLGRSRRYHKSTIEALLRSPAPTPSTDQPTAAQAVWSTLPPGIQRRPRR
ncbi:MAG: helix-turn-helix domain-containing protein [Candidatus Wallbacteria bacterium]|nr:helix-turn-helix domain-containing protein [Candidatus Wallbacteria bacterium]